jgi:hypothetical protein
MREVTTSVTTEVFTFDELTEEAQAKAVEVVREWLAGPGWDDDDNDAVKNAMVWELAAKLGTPGVHEHGEADFPGIDGVRCDGWSLDRGRLLLLSGALTRDNAPSLPWVEGIAQVELEVHQSDRLMVTVVDADPDCTCGDVDPWVSSHDEDCPTAQPCPVTDAQRGALERAVRDLISEAWMAGEKEAEGRTSEEFARDEIDAQGYEFTADGQLYAGDPGVVTEADDDAAGEAEGVRAGFEGMDQVDKIIAYEQGDLNDAETIALYQELVNSGVVWSLQGRYGRTARDLIEAGLVTDPHAK